MLTKEEALLFKSRWRLANLRTAEEISATPLATKLRQLAQMFAASEELGWSERMRAGEEEVCARWQQLREKMNGQKQAV